MEASKDCIESKIVSRQTRGKVRCSFVETKSEESVRRNYALTMTKGIVRDLQTSTLYCRSAQRNTAAQRSRTNSSTVSTPMSVTKKPSKKSSSATTGNGSQSKTKPRKPKKNQARQSSKSKRARANKNKKEYTVASTTYSQRSGKNSSSATTGQNALAGGDGRKDRRKSLDISMLTVSQSWRTSDGALLEVLSDNALRATFKDGTRVIKTSDRKVTHRPDGTRVVLYRPPLPDGLQKVTKFNDGCVIKIFTDGREVQIEPDGTIAWIPSPKAPTGKNSRSKTKTKTKEPTAASISNSQRSVNTTTQASKTSSSATTGNSSRSKTKRRQSSTPKRARVSTVPNELKSVEQIKEMLREKGLKLHRDCSNFDPEKGTTTMEGSVKCGAILKANPNIMFLYKKPNAVAGLMMTKKKMRSEISDCRYMREAGLTLPEIYSDVFDCQVNGTRTFGFLVEVVHTSMRAPYKPGAHKVTIKNIRSSFANLTADQLRVALNDIKG